MRENCSDNNCSLRVGRGNCTMSLSRNNLVRTKHYVDMSFNNHHSAQENELQLRDEKILNGREL